MSKNIFRLIILLLSLRLASPAESYAQEKEALSQSAFDFKFLGKITNNLEPVVEVFRQGAICTIEWEVIAQTNFLANSWLKINNGANCKLELWNSNGSSITPLETNTIVTKDLPQTDSITNIMKAEPRGYKHRMWLRFTGDRGAGSSGDEAMVTTLDLSTTFHMDKASDYRLKMTPMLYKSSPDGQSATLTTFQPIIMRLIHGGKVELVDN